MRDAATVLSEVMLFDAATPRELEDLAGASFTKRLGRGQVLFTAGEPADHLYVVLSGRLKIVITSDRGESLVIGFLGAGDTVGEMSVVDGLPRSAGVEALEDTALLCLPMAAVRRLLEGSAAVALSVAEDLVARLRHVTDSAADLVFLDLPRRLAKLLVATPDGLRLPQSEVAAQLGAARPTLNRALSSFQRRGWVEVQRGGVAVVDVAALARFADS